MYCPFKCHCGNSGAGSAACWIEGSRKGEQAEDRNGRQELRESWEKSEQTRVKVLWELQTVFFLYFEVTFCSPAVRVAGYCQVFVNEDLVSGIALLCFFWHVGVLLCKLKCKLILVKAKLK